jgi:hypothetical protein
VPWCILLPESNDYCREWSATLGKSLFNPFMTRQKIEQRKIKVIKQLNDLKRMVDQARLDNHSLYRTYQILKENKNLNVWMSILRSDGTTNDDSCREVLDVIEERINNNNNTNTNTNTTILLY